MKPEWAYCNVDYLKELSAELVPYGVDGALDYIINDEALAAWLDTHAMAMLVDGKPVLAAGVWPQWPGVANVWMVTTPDIFKYKLSLLKGMKMFLEMLRERDDIHRLQAWIYPGHAAGVQFAEHFGFVYEGFMRKFTYDQKDMFLYARTF